MLLAPTIRQRFPRSSAPVDHVPDVRGVHALDVLLGGDERLHALGVHARRQRQVHHQRTHLLVGREQQHAPRDVVLAGSRGEPVQHVLDAHLGTGARLVHRVDLRGPVVADQEGIQAHGAPGGGDPAADVTADAFGKELAVDDLCCHGNGAGYGPGRGGIVACI
jgi:hypothetical protein